MKSEKKQIKIEWASPLKIDVRYVTKIIVLY